MRWNARWGLLAVVAVALLAAGCAQRSRPAPVSYGKGAPGSAAVPAGGQVHVQAGDTVYSIARRYNIPVRALIDANNLQPPYQLTPGSTLVLAQGRTHTVSRGEYLSGIARKYQVDTSALARANNLAPPFTIYPNQVLQLPGSVAQAPAAPAEPTTIAGLAAMVLTSPNMGGSAPAPSAAPSQAALPLPPAVGGGQLPQRGELLSPDAAPQQAPSAPQAEPVVAVPSQPPPMPPAQPNLVPLPPSLAGTGFVWPVKGKVIVAYGPTGKGQHNDGINIAADRGTPVRAAENGVVAYAGNELRGFGNLLLVKHANGWMSAYAHNEELLVTRGAQVRRGQVIAKVGSSGGVSQPQLHFELRRGPHSVNPVEHLKDGLAQVGPAGRSPS